MRKKLLSLALTLALSLALSVPTMAASVTEIPVVEGVYLTNPGELTPTLTGFSDGLALVIGENHLLGYIDTTGKLAIPCQYTTAESFCEGMARVGDVDRNYGFINTSGEQVIPPQYLWAYDFSEGLACVSQFDNNYNIMSGFIDKTGKTVIPFQYPAAVPFSEGLAAVECENGKIGFINKSGQLVVPPLYYNVWRFSDGRARVQDKGYIDTTGKLAIPYQYEQDWDFSEGLAVVSDGNWRYGLQPLHGFIDTNGDLAIPLQYRNARSFSEGLAAVAENSEGKDGYIDKTGKVVIPFQYRNAHNFSEGVAAVRDDSTDKWGFIDKAGKVVVPFQYDITSDFSGGYATAKRDGKAFVLKLNDNDQTEEPQQPGQVFSDVAPSEWYASYVQTVYEKGLFSGTGNGTFSPNANMNYAMFITVLSQFSGDTISTVEGGAWYEGYVNWAKEKNLIPAEILEHFDPVAPISRQDMAALFGAFLEVYNPDFEKVTEAESAFADAADIADYAADGVNACFQAGIMSGGDGNTFAPLAAATRAQVAVTMVQMARIMGR